VVPSFTQRKKGQVLILPASAFCYLGPDTRDPM